MQSIRRFASIDLARENAPDATTVLHFRHLLETHGLTERIFTKINAHLAEKGLLLKEGTICKRGTDDGSLDSLRFSARLAPTTSRLKDGRLHRFLASD
jgi:IS5 family transposase